MSLDKSLTYYLAGPMRGLPKGNIPMFVAAAQSLRDMGFTIISPAEMDSPETLKDTMRGEELQTYGGLTAGQILGADVEVIHDKVGGIIFLPNWQNSRGAKLEAFVGLLTGKKFAFFHPVGSWDVINDALYQQDEIHSLDADAVRNALRRFMP